MTTIKRKLSLSSLLLLPVLLLPVPASASVSDCAVDSTWLTAPSLPGEVKKSGADGSSTFCDFYQFSSQTFLYLMSPSTMDSSKRNFQVEANYPLLEFNADGTAPANACDGAATGTTLRPSLAKSSLSTEIGRASCRERV